MRCLIVGALVLIASAGCGGSPDNPDMRRSDVRPQEVRSQEDEAALQKYIAAFGESAVDTCVRAYDAEVAAAQLSPISKPNRDLAGYLCACTGAVPCL